MRQYRRERTFSFTCTHYRQTRQELRANEGLPDIFVCGMNFKRTFIDDTNLFDSVERRVFQDTKDRRIRNDQIQRLAEAHEQVEIAQKWRADSAQGG